MRKKFIIIFSVVFALLLAFLIYKSVYQRKEVSIDMSGSNSEWIVSLNVHKNYDCILIMEPREDTPKSIEFNLEVAGESIYKGHVIYTKSANEDYLGRYTIKFEDTISAEIEDSNDISIDITYDDKTSSVKFKNKVIYD